MKSRDVLISGASVAGPALAYWLHQHGFNPTVVERSPRLRDGGYAVDFRGSVHLKVLERMGILAAIRRQQTHLGSLTYVDQDNRPLARMPAELFAGDVEILRGDLARILYEATQEGTEYLFGDSIKSLEQSADSVQVTFERAGPRTFDLVIGADGLHSNVRRLVFGEESRFIHHLGLHVAIFTAANFAGLDHAGLLYSVPGKTASIFSARDNTETIAMLFFTPPSTTQGSGDGLGDVRRQKEIVAETFAGEGWYLPELMREMLQSRDFYFDTTSQIQLDQWSSGRVGLIGDAGYAAGPGGNGTGTAVVAAYVLAGELATADGDHHAAFARYERILRGYVSGGQKQASGGRAFLAPATWKAINQRNRFFKVLPYLPIKPLIRRMSHRTTTAITLPDYNAPDREIHRD